MCVCVCVLSVKKLYRHWDYESGCAMLVMTGFEVSLVPTQVTELEEMRCLKSSGWFLCAKKFPLLKEREVAQKQYGRWALHKVLWDDLMLQRTWALQLNSFPSDPSVVLPLTSSERLQGLKRPPWGLNDWSSISGTSFTDATAEGSKPERVSAILHESLCSIRASLAVLGCLFWFCLEYWGTKT